MTHSTRNYGPNEKGVQWVGNFTFWPCQFMLPVWNFCYLFINPLTLKQQNSWKYPLVFFHHFFVILFKKELIFVCNTTVQMWDRLKIKKQYKVFQIYYGNIYMIELLKKKAQLERRKDANKHMYWFRWKYRLKSKIIGKNGIF